MGAWEASRGPSVASPAAGCRFCTGAASLAPCDPAPRSAASLPGGVSPLPVCRAPAAGYAAPLTDAKIIKANAVGKLIMQKAGFTRNAPGVVGNVVSGVGGRDPLDGCLQDCVKQDAAQQPVHPAAASTGPLVVGCCHH